MNHRWIAVKWSGRKSNILEEKRKQLMMIIKKMVDLLASCHLTSQERLVPTMFVYFTHMVHPYQIGAFLNLMTLY